MGRLTRHGPWDQGHSFSIWRSRTSINLNHPGGSTIFRDLHQTRPSLYGFHPPKLFCHHRARIGFEQGLQHWSYPAETATSAILAASPQRYHSLPQTTSRKFLAEPIRRLSVEAIRRDFRQSPTLLDRRRHLSASIVRPGRSHTFKIELMTGHMCLGLGLVLYCCCLRTLDIYKYLCTCICVL